MVTTTQGRIEGWLSLVKPGKQTIFLLSEERAFVWLWSLSRDGKDTFFFTSAAQHVRVDETERRGHLLSLLSPRGGPYEHRTVTGVHVSSVGWPPGRWCGALVPSPSPSSPLPVVANFPFPPSSPCSIGSIAAALTSSALPLPPSTPTTYAGTSPARAPSALLSSDPDKPPPPHRRGWLADRAGVLRLLLLIGGTPAPRIQTRRGGRGGQVSNLFATPPLILNLLTL